MRSFVVSLLASAAIVGAVAYAHAAGGQVVTPPKARYVMDAGTITGFAGRGGGMGAAMGMMFGGGGREARELHLRLGSTLAPEGGKPKADHFPSPGGKMGKSLPLITPDREPPAAGDMPEERPRGRLLLFWGCGVKAAKGQPVVIDFAKVAKGQMPAGLSSVRVPRDPGPTLGNSRTYGHWPNSKGGKPPSASSSLIGEHRVAGNYTPEMRFTLAKDFMRGLSARSQSLPGGATTISWGTIPDATGYMAFAMGMKMAGNGEEPQDMVWWTSASAKEFYGGLTDWLSPATVARLVGEKLVMPPTQTNCTIPAEVRAAAPSMMMGTLYAYGPEENFVHPPRPADPKIAWNQEWTAKVRHRSMTSWMIVSPMGGAMSGEADGGGDGKSQCKPGLGGMLGGVLGGKGC